MKFTIEKDIFKSFPTAKIGGLFIFGLDNSKESANINRILKQYTNSALKEGTRLEQKKITSWNNSLNQLGIDPKTHIPSHKALLKRATSKGEIPNISPLVNLYNFISLKFTLPIGGHDLDTISEVIIGKTTGKETFIPMNSESSEAIPEGEYAYLDKTQGSVLTRNLVWRQSNVDKITTDTKNVFVPIDDLPGNFDYEEIEKIATELASLIKKELGLDKAVFGIANKYTPELDSDNLPEISFDMNSAERILNKRMDVITDEKKIDEVLSKGVKEIFPGNDVLKELMMSGKRLKLYTGIDPTANFIHMGHMIWMKKLSEFQQLGHEIMFLVGGFTAMIGDPDKKYTREPLTKEDVRNNFENYKTDASKILDFDMKDNPVQIVNNFDWLSKLTLEDWLGVMSNVTLQHILSHDMFKNRLENQTPIRLHEIIYPLLQGYDSVAMEVDMEVGGSDQTFNMLTGRILERNMIGREKFVLTMKLLTDNSGKKMGKTTGNAISFKDSADDVYGKVMSFSDEVLPLAYELLSKKTTSEIEVIEKSIPKDPMKYKKDLAFEITRLIHSEDDAKNAEEHFERTVQNKETPDEIPTFKIDDLGTEKSINIIDLLDKTKLVPSRGEAKRLIQQGGVKIDGEKINQIEDVDLKENSVIQVGKRKWMKLI